MDENMVSSVTVFHNTGIAKIRTDDRRLLTLELLPPLARSEALHAERVEASLRLGLSRLFGEASREGLEDATVVEERQKRWLSSPALLFFLLLLRSSPGWLFAGEGALLLKLESSLAEHLRSSDGEGARTLLLLRPLAF
ncbi:hypothetical protein AK812_SmicGene46020 [Symbiodinium microadriaticum]|uniref:Uncharacterized protein n=1 Tax=Symbiodinium microadriaticum TaxID=2951 RepID=A0A1Q9BV20_SYMMI|nr:hypothetical protein AK812_SmicGene46020 [Symbiodinium microadriaticum]